MLHKRDIRNKGNVVIVNFGKAFGNTLNWLKNGYGKSVIYSVHKYKNIFKRKYVFKKIMLKI